MTDIPSKHELHIVEDREADYVALSRAIKLVMREKKLQCDLLRHETSEDAYDALLQGARPDLMFIDLRLTGESGLSFLARVKTDARIVPCPKVILTSSAQEDDVERCFREGAAGYLVKPMRHGELVASVRICLDYWFDASKRPKTKDTRPASSC